MICPICGAVLKTPMLEKGKTTVGPTGCPKCGPDIVPIPSYQNAPKPKGKEKTDVVVRFAEKKKKKLPFAPKIHVSDEFEMMEGGIPGEIPGGEFKMISDPDADNKDEKYLKHIRLTADDLAIDG